MTRHAQNCIDLLSDNQPEKILQALKMLRSDVVQELMDYYEVNTNEDLADKMFLLG